ncbi:MAG TPA: alpha/beta family hydrolase [Gaiellaceae bacterium]|jgi:putative phosphoribosyl transferase
MNTRENDVAIPVGDVQLVGTLRIPEGADGIVLFAHGSGSSRASPRNRHVAAVLEHAGLATMLIDLLSEHEEKEDSRTGALRFDIPLLADRILAATVWLHANEGTTSLPLGLFGASTGAGAALLAAAGRPELIKAVVSRGGRPDLAGKALRHVSAPTLLIVGERDAVVLDLNQRAAAELATECRLEIVPGATHLFEEPGALEKVAVLARDWFSLHLAGRTAG